MEVEANANRASESPFTQVEITLTTTYRHMLELKYCMWANVPLPHAYTRTRSPLLCSIELLAYFFQKLPKHLSPSQSLWIICCSLRTRTNYVAHYRKGCHPGNYKDITIHFWYEHCRECTAARVLSRWQFWDDGVFQSMFPNAGFCTKIKYPKRF